MSKSEVELLQGTLDVLILKSLSLGSRHGAALVRWLEQVTQGQLVVEEGSLYPALHRMQEKGWISSEWGHSETNRRSRFYSLTEEGQRQLIEQMDAWVRTVRMVTRVFSAHDAKPPSR